jgi:hypothetical protein
MRFVFPTNKVPFTLVVGVKTKSPQQIKVEASDGNKPATYYVNRKGDVTGYREFELKFPQSPNTAVLNIYNLANGNFPNDEDGSFQITRFDVKQLHTEPIWLSESDRSFIKFAQEFSENAGIISAGDKRPHIYRSDDGQFTIDYYYKIRNRNTGGFVNTPARIGHNSGIIEVSKNDFVKYSVPMRMIILLHEYSHKYKNPNINKPIAYETGADINALNMYLSLGYSEMEAQQAFLYVFKGANNAVNHKRYLIINDFITKYNNGEIKKNFSSNGIAQR